MVVTIDSRMTTIGNLVFLRGSMDGGDFFDFKDHVKTILSFNVTPVGLDPASPPVQSVGLWDEENGQRVSKSVIETPQPILEGATTVRINGTFRSIYSMPVNFLLIGRR